MKKILAIFLFCIIGWNVYSQDEYTQSAYTLNLTQDIIISTLGLGLYIGAHFVNSRPGTAETLNRSDINAFDRWLTFPWNDSLYDARNVVMFGLNFTPFIVPLALAGVDIRFWKDERRRNTFNTWLTYGIMYGQATLFAYGTRILLGRAITRYRPGDHLVDNLKPPLDTDSFPSGSTVVVFLPATFLSITFSTEFPDSPWRLPVIIGSFTLAGFVGAQRIQSGAHYLTDVLAGAAIGAFYGWLIPTLHRRRDNNGNDVDFYFTGNGMIMSLRL